MRLVGWNEIPDGYGSWFDISRAPLWLQLWFRTPVLDKFAYPVAVRRGFGYLTPEPGLPPDSSARSDLGGGSLQTVQALRASSRRTARLLIRVPCDDGAAGMPELCGGIAPGAV